MSPKELRLARESLNLTQTELAARIGVSLRTLQEWEKTKIPETKIAQVVKVLSESGYEEIAYPPPSSKIEEIKTYEVPLIPLDAIGGRLDGFAPNGVTISQCETITSPFKTATLAIRVKGQSMSPIYPSGCMLFIVKNNGNWLDWGNVYVLDTDNGVIVKQLSPSQMGEKYICCKSFNNSPEYAPFDVPRTSIYGIYRVLGAMTEL